MQKLNEKGQSADKQKQAYQSVKVYLDIVANEKKQDDNQKFRDGNEVKTLNVASSDTASPAIFFRQTMTSELFRKVPITLILSITKPDFFVFLFCFFVVVEFTIIFASGVI
ncbi:MAG: hypothetical protein ACOX2I_00215 [Candidatus Ozemobacteraceae bacterium]